MLRRFFALMIGRRPPELQAALVAQPRAVERSIAGSHQSAATLRDVRLNTRSALASIDHSWDQK